MEDYKNLNAPLGQSERASSIPAPRSSLGNLARAGVAQLRQTIAMAQAQYPANRTFAYKSEDQARLEIQASENAQKKIIGGERPRKAYTMFAVGDDVLDTKDRVKGTILTKNVAVASDGSPIHELVDRRGNSWKRRESRLKKL